MQVEVHKYGCNLKSLAFNYNDIFITKTLPAKTQAIGTSYVSLECVSFLTGLECDITVIVKGRVLRYLDNEFSGKFRELMHKHDVKLIDENVLSSIKQ